MMKRLLANKRFQTFALGIGVASIIIGIGAAFFVTIFPYNEENRRKAVQLEELRKQREEYYKKDKHLQSPNK